MSNTITTYGRRYGSFEFMLKHMAINSYFLIRLKVDVFINERKYMKTNDEIIEIKINATQVQNFHDKKLKKQSLVMKSRT